MKNKLLIYIQKFGILKTFNKALLKIISPIFYYQKDILFERNIDENIGKIKPKLDVIIRKATKKDGYLFEKAVSKDYKKDFLKRINNSDCFIAVYKGKLAHRIWATYKDFYVKDIKIIIHLKKNEAFIFDATTSTKFRGKEIHPAVIQYIVPYLKNRKIKKILATISWNNYPSLKGIYKVGFKPVKTMVYIILFNKLVLKKDFEKKLKLYFN